MQIALIGGTGDVGEAFALRFARDTDHGVVIGSRDPAKAERAASEYRETLSATDATAAVEGAGNAAAAARGDLVVLTVPPYHVADAVASIADELDATRILVTPAVGMTGDEDGLHYKPPGAGSVAALVADAAPDGVPVVGAGTNLSAHRLADLSEAFEMDTLAVGDDAAAKSTVAEAFGGLDGVRVLDAGPLANAAEVESLTPLLINVARYNDGVEDAGVRFV